MSGALNVLAGVALLVYWYSFALFPPYRKLSTTLSMPVENRNWTWINALGALGAPASALGSLFGRLQLYPRTLGMSLMRAGDIWIGIDTNNMGLITREAMEERSLGGPRDDMGGASRELNVDCSLSGRRAEVTLLMS